MEKLHKIQEPLRFNGDTRPSVCTVHRKNLDQEVKKQIQTLNLCTKDSSLSGLKGQG